MTRELWHRSGEGLDVPGGGNDGRLLYQSSVRSGAHHLFAFRMLHDIKNDDTYDGTIWHQ